MYRTKPSRRLAQAAGLPHLQSGVDEDMLLADCTAHLIEVADANVEPLDRPIDIERAGGTAAESLCLQFELDDRHIVIGAAQFRLSEQHGCLDHAGRERGEGFGEALPMRVGHLEGRRFRGHLSTLVWVGFAVEKTAAELSSESHQE